MPMYEYYCTDCRDKFDALRPMGKADEVIQCKHCESMKTSRMLSMFAAHSKPNGGAPPIFDTGARAVGGGCCGGGKMCGCVH